MFNPFQETKKIPVERWSALPPKFRKKGRTLRSDPNRQLAAVDSFLEGPSFDRDGNLWCVDIPFGRIFRVDRKRGWQERRDLHRRVQERPAQARPEERKDRAFSRPRSASFKGLNDLHFADNDDLYFTGSRQWREVVKKANLKLE